MFSHHRFHFLVNSHYEYHVKSRSDRFLFSWILFLACLDLFSPRCELPFLVLYTEDDVAAFSSPLFLSLPPSLPLFPSPLFFFPLCDQTQTQLEHARIRELEQSLLFEKAQAEKLLRELEDTRVMDPHLPCLQNSALAPALVLMMPCFGFLFFQFMGLSGFGLNLGFPDFFF